MMSLRVLLISAALCWVAPASHANDACDKTQPQYRDTLLLVDSLRPEKPGQMRVFANDGTEFNAGQAQWLKGQLRKLDRLCARGGPAEAAEAEKVRASVNQLIDSHRRRS